MKTKSVTIICIFVLILSFFLIGLGFYITIMLSPNHIISTSINEVGNALYTILSKDDIYDLGDDFSLEGRIDYNLDSEYYRQQNSAEYNLINSLNNLTTSFIIQHDKTNKKALFSIEEKLLEEEILNYKYLIENSTAYEYDSKISKNYVNNGTSNYFESFQNDYTAKSNIEYLYSFIIKSLKNDLKDEYFETYNLKQTNGKKIKQTSLVITNELIRNVYNGILKDIEHDERANLIISSMYPNYKKSKLNDSDYFLEKNESIILNIYTTSFFDKTVKYELVKIINDDKYLFVYEGNITSGTFFYIKNNQVLYQATMERDNNILINITNSKEEKVGEIRLTKEEKLIDFNIVFDNNNSKLDINYTSKYNSIKNNKSYQNDKKLSFKVIEDKLSILNGDIIVSYNIDQNVEINEDVSNAVLQSGLTEEEKSLFKNQNKRIQKHLEGGK